MTPREFRQEQEFEFDHFIQLTSTGIKPNYVNIELFAHEYHKRKLKLLGIGAVVGRSEQLCVDCNTRTAKIGNQCISCNHEWTKK